MCVHETALTVLLRVKEIRKQDCHIRDLCRLGIVSVSDTSISNHCR